MTDCTQLDDNREHYKELAPASIAAYGGRYVVRGRPSEVLEGSWQAAV